MRCPYAEQHTQTIVVAPSAVPIGRLADRILFVCLARVPRGEHGSVRCGSTWWLTPEQAIRPFGGPYV